MATGSATLDIPRMTNGKVGKEAQSAFSAYASKRIRVEEIE
jgi:hypothetical protein